jgi:methionine sulfoxide reductase heme-binding subunit
LNTAQRYRFLYKPLVFALALTPAIYLTLGAFGLAGVELGADPVREILHRCGKTALQLLLLTLLVTPLREITGWRDLLRLRRMLGLFAFFYALLHFTTYAWLDQGLDLHAIGEDILKRPYITIGLAGLLLLVPLAVTSTNRMMRRLGRRWTQLHRLIYLVTLLGLWHFWWQVKKDIREPLFYALVFAALMAWRLRARFAPARAPGRSAGPAP